MTSCILKQRYYVLTPLSVLLGVLVLIATLLLAFTSYQRSIAKTVGSYEQMLVSIDATLLQEMALRNQNQLAVLEASLDKEAIARGRSAVNPSWAIAHQFKRDAHFLYFYNARTQRISSYPDRPLPADYHPQQRPWYRALASDSEELIWFGPYPDFGSDKQSLTLIKRVLDEQGLLGLLMVDMSFESLQHALQRAMGNKPVAIYLTNRDSGQLVVGHNMALLPAEGTAIPAEITGCSASLHGVHLKVPLENIGWDLNLYLPPAVFNDSLWETLLMVVLPALALLTTWLCSLLFLIRIFRQEQTLVEETLSGIRRSGGAMIPTEQPVWFVHDSLGEIDQVRTSLLQKQDALLCDPLTSIMNRRAFEQDRAEFEQSDTPYWLVLFDVDNFKRVNDCWGHSVGDAVLCRVATIMVRTLGDRRVYRIGGDEFAALLPWGGAEVEQRLTHLLARVRSLQWREFKSSITLSAGGARYPDETKELFELADECLYRSKHSGRDCWHLAPLGSGS
ncbi:MAG: diguanylate cyclase domain-containing protein [Aeromonas sp.]|uniref:GGDEF domain-containing protein n=1 Tax=Aeromonas sp. TaxID=647 RepID=UPI003F38E25A